MTTVMNEQNDLMILDAVERYIRGEMLPDERLHFENLRKSNSEVDQLVVEHTLFLQQMNRYAERQDFRHTLHDVHNGLSEQGTIDIEPAQRGRVLQLWQKYKKVVTIAATIAGVTAIALSMLVNTVAPPTKDPKVIELANKVNEIEIKTDNLDKKIQHVDNKTNTAHNTDINMAVNVYGTGFLIDPKGMMITNAHVVKNSRNIYVENNRGERFRAIVLKLDVSRDMAIIKIDDDRFKPFSALPYGIRKTTSELAEPIFTLGFPREEIVYGEGYLSAKTGFNGDTLSCQISVAANPGNSGGPIFNRNGEVIGILSTKETKTEGAVFAVQSKYIFQALEELKGNPLYKHVQLSTRSSIGGMDKVQQVKKVQDYVFMVKGD
jgi:serine protease Do